MNRASSDARFFLWRGRLVPRINESLTHVRIVANLLFVCAHGLNETSEVLPSNLRVRIPGEDSYVHPDAVVVCGEPVLEDKHADTLLNPSVVIEVLTDSTETFDRGRKWEGYRKIPSLRAYVLVSQKSSLIEVFERTDTDAWLFRAYVAGQSLSISLAHGALTLEVDRVYARVFGTRNADAS